MPESANSPELQYMAKISDIGSRDTRVAYGSTAEQAIHNFATEVLGKNSNLYPVKTLAAGGARFAKRHPFASTITAYELSPRLRSDLAQEQQLPRVLDKFPSRLNKSDGLFFNSEKGQVQYWNEAHYNRRQDNIENTIECGEPVTRPDPVKPYRTSPGANGATVVNVPNQDDLPCKEKLVPEIFQQIIDRYADGDPALIDSYIRAVKNEPDPRARKDRPGPLSRDNPPPDQDYHVFNTAGNFYRDIDDLYEYLSKHHWDRETEKIKENLKTVFGRSERIKAIDAENQPEEGKKNLPPTTSIVITENPEIANRYRMCHCPSGDLLLADPEQGKPLIRVSHTKIRTLMATDQSIAHSIALAKEKQWPSIKVSGTKNYRQRVWLEAQSQQPPLAVTGYQPTDQDLAILAQRLQAADQNTLTPAPVKTAAGDTQTGPGTPAPAGYNGRPDPQQSAAAESQRQSTPARADQGWEVD